MQKSSSMFADALMRWSKAILDNQYQVAADTARMLRKHGDLILIHPEFQNTWQRECPDIEARKALDHLVDFLHCMASAKSAHEHQSAKSKGSASSLSFDPQHARRR